jgi:hypothetical protein
MSPMSLHLILALSRTSPVYKLATVHTTFFDFLRSCPRAGKRPANFRTELLGPKKNWLYGDQTWRTHI